MERKRERDTDSRWHHHMRRKGTILMKRRIIIFSTMGAVLAIAPLADARSGRIGRRRAASSFCVAEACVVATSTPTTTPEPDPTRSTDPAATDPTEPGVDPSTSTGVSADPSTSTETTVTTETPGSPSTGTTTASTEPSTPTETTSASSTPDPTTTAPSDTTAATGDPTTTAVSVDTPPPSASTSSSQASVPPETSPSTTAAPPTTVAPPAATMFTMSTSSPVVGEAVTFDGSDVACDPGVACSYTWQWFYRTDGGTLLTGGQMGRTPVITYAFDAFAASKSAVIVTLTVAQGRVGPRQTYTTTFVVAA